MEPSKFERAKMGAMMGGAVGLCIGLVFGGVSILRYNPALSYLQNLFPTHHVQYSIDHPLTFATLLHCDDISNGPGSRGYVETLTRTMVSSTATFAFFMAIGSVIRSEEALAIDYASLDQNREKKNIWGQSMRFKTPPVVILQQQQQHQQQQK
ncbi:hypothetical protein KVV02_008133 [Mortierella alpina]|uniref:Uncharacterized protein n=1 Tax=Mortierella alpina TaxID=64518 RepID=A0A9P8CVF0_MORAP|nr:hypothetical protein KVV02_008133 [Mortierella alpina]